MKNLLIFLVLLLSLGCNRSFHSKHKLNPKTYFDDAKVVELCTAIEKQDVALVEKCISDGANVKAIGKDGMTPLLWAYPTMNREIFLLLLINGADPNVLAKSDFDCLGTYFRGAAVTHLVCRSKNPYFDLVFEHGGNANLADGSDTDCANPLFYVIEGGGPDRKERIRKLIDLGADVNFNKSRTPLVKACNYGRQFDICLFLIELGADPFIVNERTTTYFTHYLIGEKALGNFYSARHEADLNQLIAFVESKGDSLKDASVELERLRAQEHKSEGYLANQKRLIQERIDKFRDMQKK